MIYWVLRKKLMWHLLLNGVKTWILHAILTKFTLCLLISSKHFFFFLMGKGRRESCTYKDCVKKFLQKKGLLWKNNGTVSRIVRRKFLEHKLFSKLWVVRKLRNFIKKEKRTFGILANLWNCVFSLFNRKLKNETAWDHHSTYWYWET